MRPLRFLSRRTRSDISVCRFCGQVERHGLVASRVPSTQADFLCRDCAAKYQTMRAVDLTRGDEALAVTLILDWCAGDPGLRELFGYFDPSEDRLASRVRQWVRKTLREEPKGRSRLAP